MADRPVRWVDEAPADLNQSAIHQAFQVRDGSVISLSLEPEPVDSLRVVIPLDGARYALDLQSDSVRAPGYRLLVQQTDGSYVSVEPGPVRTMSGVVAEVEGTVVTGSWSNDGLHAVILLDDDRRYVVEPLAPTVADAAPGLHILYRSDFVVPYDGTCQEIDPDEEDRPDLPSGVAKAIGDVRVAQIACDADAAFFRRFGDAASTAAHIEAVLHATNAQFERDVGIRHVISAIIVRTTELDHYDSTEAASLLRGFARQWHTQHTDIPRDVAQLFTGKDLDGTTIGVAWRYGICNDNAYGVVQSGCCSNFSCKTDLSAHELGHNWGAAHCACERTTMNSTLTCGNRFHSTLSIPDMTDYANTRSCLYTGPRVLSLLIDGPPEVIEGRGASYRAIATFSDGDSRDVTAGTEWHAGPAARIDADGTLEAGFVNTDTPTQLRAVYRDETGMATREITVRVVDLPEPQSRSVEIAVVANADPGALRVGQTFEASVLLSSPEGEVANVRFIQLDAGRSTGVRLERIQWDFEGLVDPNAYELHQGASILRAAYQWESPLTGLIVRLTEQPQRVARIALTVLDDGELNLLGIETSQLPTEGARLVAGFARLQEFTPAAGNLRGGRLRLDVNDRPLSIVSSLPPDGAIDARQPHDVMDSSRQGWQTVELTFSDDPSSVAVSDFVVTASGGEGLPPAPLSLEFMDHDSVRLNLSAFLEVGVWTVIFHEPSGTFVQLAPLPADIDGDLSSSPADISVLLEALNQRGDGRVPWSVDINRSGELEPGDLLRTIDLLNGAGAYGSWNGRGIQ